jgi:hypothetical protein
MPPNVLVGTFDTVCLSLLRTQRRLTPLVRARFAPTLGGALLADRRDPKRKKLWMGGVVFTLSVTSSGVRPVGRRSQTRAGPSGSAGGAAASSVMAAISGEARACVRRNGAAVLFAAIFQRVRETGTGFRVILHTCQDKWAPADPKVNVRRCTCVTSFTPYSQARDGGPRGRGNAAPEGRGAGLRRCRPGAQ